LLLISEVFESGALNIGSGILNHTTGTSYVFNPTLAFGAGTYLHQKIANGGYGNISEVTVSYIVPNAITMTHASNYIYGGTEPVGYSGVTSYPESSVAYDSNNKLVTFKLKAKVLGSDGLLTAGEYTDFYPYFIVPNYCGVFQTKTFAYFSCGTGTPLCQQPDTLVSTVKVTAGIPKIEGKLIAAESPDGCPNKAISFFYKNTGTGSAAPIGNAYDIDLGISFGGGKMTISNVKLNNTLISSFPIALTPSGIGTAFTMKIKNTLTVDPDGPGIGLEDLDGDGYFDDMKSGDSTRVDFNYIIPCDIACGSDFHYELQSFATYTDFCKVLVGNNYTPLQEFHTAPFASINVHLTRLTCL
jgi:hypothetical protein